MVLVRRGRDAGDLEDGVGSSGLIGAYVRALVARTRAAGIDADRLACEVTDHLRSAAELHLLAGCDADEAERRAIEGFGDAEWLATAVISIGPFGKGGAVRRIIRACALAAALLATAVLVVAHLASPSGPDTTLRWAGVASAGVIGLAGAAFAGTRWRRRPWHPAGAGRWIPWLAASAVLAGLSAWGYGRMPLGVLTIHQGGRLHLAAAVMLTLFVVWTAGRTGARFTAGIGLIGAGLVGLAFSGMWNRAWLPFGDIGAGKGNVSVALLAAGWAFLAIEWLRWHDGRGVRIRAGAWLTRIGERLASQPGVREAQPGV